MPTRLIREGFIDSDRVNRLTAPAECFYFRLFLKADDYGRFDARASMLKSHLFPVKDSVRAADCVKWLRECEEVNLVHCYEVAGKPYVALVDFRQKVRSKSKYPPPEDIPEHLLTDANNCLQMLADVHLGGCECGDVCEDTPKPPQGGDEDKPKRAKRRKAVIPSSLAEVEAYVQERGSIVNAKNFYEYYEAGDWHDGKGKPVLNWKQKLLTWEQHGASEAPKRQPKPDGPPAGWRQVAAEIYEGATSEPPEYWEGLDQSIKDEIRERLRHAS